MANLEDIPQPYAPEAERPRSAGIPSVVSSLQPKYCGTWYGRFDSALPEGRRALLGSHGKGILPRYLA